MKSKKALLLVMAVLTIMSAIGLNLNTVVAESYNGYRTTIIDSEGLNIEVADIVGNTIEDSEDYIRNNLNEAYAKSEKMEPMDLIYVKHLIAENSGFNGEKTIDAMYDESIDAFVMMNDYGTVLYNTDDNSDYYVAYVNNLRDDYSYTVTDHSFAYTNLDGEAINDAIYDYETGIAYVPKKYTEENKNGQGLLNVQVELLQVTESINMTSTINVEMKVDEELTGKFAQNGTSTLNAVATEFGLRVALDEEAKNNISRNYFKVEVNGAETHEWEYYEKEGILVIKFLPNTIETLTIGISSDNVDANVDYMMQNQGISSYASVNVNDMEYYDFIGTWTIDPDNKPQAGDSWYVESDRSEGFNAQFVDIYYASELNPDNLGVPIPLYNEGSDMGWTKIVDKIWNDKSIDINNLVKNDQWIQHQIRVNRDLETHGITIPAGTLIWLKCSHATTSFSADSSTGYDHADGGDPREHAWKMKMRVLDISDEYMVMGIITTKLHNQAGAGIFKVRLSPGKGSMEVAKKDSHGNLVAGAKFVITGPDDYRKEVWSEDGKATPIEDLKPGEYVVTEVQAPDNMIINTEGKRVTVEPGEKSECTIDDRYQRGAAQLIKYDEKNRGNTQGDATLEGAVFDFYAKDEIYEGHTLLFRAGEKIKTVTTNAEGETPVIREVHSNVANKDLDGLPIGTYYYEEVSAPEGFMLKEGKFEVTITYDSDGPAVTPPVGLEVGDKPIYNDFELVKYIGETSNTPREPISGAVFTATLVSSGKTYVSTTTDANGYCIIRDLPYGTYHVEETTVPANTRPCSGFTFKVELDKSETDGPYGLDDVKFDDPENTYEDQAKSWTDDEGRLIEEPEVMQLKIRKQDQDILDSDPVYKAQGDAHLKGAKYQVYHWNSETNTYDKTKRLNGGDYIITVDHQDAQGYWVAETDDLLIGKYMVKELVKNTSVGNDGKTYKNSYAEGYKVDEKEHYFVADPVEQETRISYHHSISKEPVIRGSAKVVKYDNEENNSSDDKDPSTEVPSKGAVLRLVLNSSIPASARLEEGKETEYYMQGTVWYEVKLDEYGSGEFKELNDDTHWTSVNPTYGAKYADYKIGDIGGLYDYCCTIPFGQYTLIENKESDYSENTHFYIKPQPVTIERETDIRYVIEADNPVPMYLKIQKRDTDTGATVNLTGTKFKVWDCKNNEFVTQLSTKDQKFISEFETNEYGLVTMPEQLVAGEYIVYETDPAKGYYWEDDLRVPKEEDIGVIGKGGKHIVIDKNAMNIKVDTVSNKKYYYYTIDLSDRPLKGKIEVIKTGEMLDGFDLVDKNIKANNTKYSVTNPKYKEKGLKGVEYTITAKNDIKSPDGRVTYETAGTTHVITTNENGYAITDDLYLGTYEIKETKTPLGYVTDKNIPDITLVNEDKTERINTTTKDYNNKKQPTQVQVEKVLESLEYDVKPDSINVVIGIYANEDLYTSDGNKVISKNTMLDVVEGTIDTEELNEGRNTITLTSDVNLPNNKTYYAKELYVDFPYEMETEKQVFEVKAKNTDDEILKVHGITIYNDGIVASELAFIKISTSALINEAKALYGGVLSDEEYDAIMDPILKWVQSTPTSTVKAVLNGEQETDNADVAKCRFNSKYTLSGAVYSIYYDEGKKEPLTKKGVPVTVTTDDKGFASLAGIPVGEYYIFEEVSPVLIWKDEKGEHTIPYDKQDGSIKVSLTREDKDKSIARLFTDDITIDGNLKFTKEDIFTGELIPDCTFEITDSDGDVIVNAITDDEGKYQLNLDWFDAGETYYYTEISAPGIYDLNTEPHEFKIEFDENGELVQHKIENRRKTRDLLIRKTDAETGELLQGCVFTIAMINEDGTQKVNAKTGEPIYLVENAVTDENGEYYIEDAPMGNYMFTEITPPEGYELDEDLTGYKFTLDENSPELTIFEVTNTGDIAVIALACVAVVCVLGIAFVIIKNKKSSKK